LTIPLSYNTIRLSEASKRFHKNNNSHGRFGEMLTTHGKSKMTFRIQYWVGLVCFALLVILPTASIVESENTTEAESEVAEVLGECLLTTNSKSGRKRRSFDSREPRRKSGKNSSLCNTQHIKRRGCSPAQLIEHQLTEHQRMFGHRLRNDLLAPMTC